MDDKLKNQTQDAIFDNSISTAANAADNIGTGIEIIKTHFQQVKTQKWRNQISWLMTCVRNEALNGVDALDAVQPQANKTALDKGIRHTHNRAQGALFSDANPQKGALMLAQPQPNSTSPTPLFSYISQCQTVQQVISRSLNTHSEDQADRNTSQANKPRLRR